MCGTIKSNCNGFAAELKAKYPGSEVQERPKSERLGRRKGPLAERDKPL